MPETIIVTVPVTVSLVDDYTEIAEQHQGECEQIKYLKWGGWDYDQALLDHSPRLRSFFGETSDKTIFEMLEMLAKNDLKYAFACYEWLTKFFSLDILKRYAPTVKDYEKWAWEVYAWHLSDMLDAVEYKDSAYDVLVKKAAVIHNAFRVNWVGEEGKWMNLIFSLLAIYLRGNDIEGAIAFYNLYKETQKPTPSQLMDLLNSISFHINEYSKKLYEFALSEASHLPFSSDLVAQIKKNKNTHNVAEDICGTRPINYFGETPTVISAISPLRELM